MLNFVVKAKQKIWSTKNLKDFELKSKTKTNDVDVTLNEFYDNLKVSTILIRQQGNW